MVTQRGVVTQGRVVRQVRVVRQIRVGSCYTSKSGNNGNIAVYDR